MFHRISPAIYQISHVMIDWFTGNLVMMDQMQKLFGIECSEGMIMYC